MPHEHLYIYIYIYIYEDVQLSHSLILVTESSNVAPHRKERSEDLKWRIVALHEDGHGYKKIASTLKLSCNTVAKIIKRF